MKTEVGWPGPPLRASVRPGVRTRMSATLVSWSSRISAPVSTVTDWPTWLTDSGERLAVTTTVGVSVAAPEPAKSGVGAVAWARAASGTPKAARDRAAEETAARHVDFMVFSECKAARGTATPDDAAARAKRDDKPSFGRNPYRTAHLGRAMDSRVGQVSWLAGQHLDRRLPRAPRGSSGM